MHSLGPLLVILSGIPASWASPIHYGVNSSLSPLQNQYDPVEAQHFASLSSVTYCSDKSKVLDWSCGACKQSETPLVPGKIRIIDSGKKNATRIIVGKLQSQHGCLMAFRGSSNVENWIRDFQFWEIHPAPYKNCEGCKVHSGFYAIWQAVKHQVLSAIDEVGCGQFAPGTPDNLLYITGHSLGAALTHLAMFDLTAQGWNIAKTYSFEAPRVGNSAFSSGFSARFTDKFPVFRITHYKDPIVHLPPSSFGYHHVQPEVYYDHGGKYTVCSDGEDRKCADRYSELDIPGLVLLHSGDHCSTPLVPNGDLCNPPQC